MTRPHSLSVAIGTAALLVGFAFAAPAAMAATATAPSAPTGLAAIPGNTTVTLSWVAPSANGSPILGYNLYQGTSAGGESSTALNGSTLISATTATVTGLTNAKTYYFVAKAVNAIGTSPASNEVWAVPAATVPGAPTLVVAVAGDISATVTWSAPSSPGGSNITRYTVLAHNLTAPPSGGQTCIWSSGPLSCLLTGLTNGDSYNFTVAATNSLGTGAVSNPSATVVPAPTAPSAPTGLVATPGNTTVQLSWVAPSNGGSAITGYNVFDSKTAGGENYKTPVNGTTLITTTGTTVTGLVNDTEYYFTVKALNAIGSSVPSSEVWAIPAGIVPSAPRTVAATRGYESATVRWAAPSSLGGSAILRYNVTAADSTVSSRGGQSCVWTTGPLSCVVSGLTDGDSYTFTLVATNSVGTSVASPASNVVVPAASAPEAPVGLSVVPGNATVQLSWSAPVDNGSAIVGYNLYQGSSSGGESATPVNGSVLITVPKVTVSSLTNGHTYYYVAKAVNAAGTSAASNEVWAIPSPTVPSTPTNVTASPLGNESAVVAWTPPASMGGSAVTSYAVTAYLGTSAQASTSFGPTVTTGTVTNLIPGSAYTFTVEALNASGASAPSAPSPAALLPRASTTVALVLSARKVTYGHEQNERFWVSVGARFSPVAPGGSVTIRKSTTTLCTIKVSAGIGSCALPSAELHAGTFGVYASYSRNNNFVGSTSTKKTLVVDKATTKTALTLSVTTVTYGHEQHERFSVIVRPQYPATTPTGTVTINGTPCRISLSSGKGSCTSSATTLRAGTHRLVATYWGSSSLLGSKSSNKTVTVLK